MALDIVITKGEGGTYRVKLAGMLDEATASELDRRMIEVWADDQSRVLRMELHDLTFISSAGLGLLSNACAAGAAEISIPRRILYVDKVPLLGNGKKDYVTLARMVETQAVTT